MRLRRPLKERLTLSATYPLEERVYATHVERKRSWRLALGKVKHKAFPNVLRQDVQCAVHIVPCLATAIGLSRAKGRDA